MKRILFIISLFILTTNISNATTAFPQNPNIKDIKDIQANQEFQRRAARHNHFETRLGLSEKQKAKAREIRLKGHENLRPVLEQLHLKHQEAQMVKMSRISVEVQEERLSIIDKEIKVLEKRVHDIKKQNMKEFESILNRNQKNILKEMKNEGRRKFKEEHPVKTPLTIPQNFTK